MDEQEREARIAALFHDATAEAPPPGFDAGDVVAASRRITRRRRSALAGAALAVLAVAGVGVTAGLGGGAGSELTTAAGSAQGAPARNGSAQDAAAPEAARAAAPEAAAPDAAGAAAGSAAGADAAAPDPGSAASAPGGGPTAGFSAGAVPPVAAPLGPGTRECADRQDPALRALVEQVLPEVTGASEAVTTMECRPGGERGVVLEVSDGTSSGLLSVTYLPPGSTAASNDTARTAPTASGGTVLVSSRAGRAGEPAPFEDRLDAAVAFLAPRL